MITALGAVRGRPAIPFVGPGGVDGARGVPQGRGFAAAHPASDACAEAEGRHRARAGVTAPTPTGPSSSCDFAQHRPMDDDDAEELAGLARVSTGSASSRRSSATTCAASPTADDGWTGRPSRTARSARRRNRRTARAQSPGRTPSRRGLAAPRRAARNRPRGARSRLPRGTGWHTVIWTTRLLGRKAGGGGAARGLPPARTLLASAGTPTGTTPAAAARIVRKGAGQMGCTTTCCPPGARGRPDSQAATGVRFPSPALRNGPRESRFPGPSSCLPLPAGDVHALRSASSWPTSSSLSMAPNTGLRAAAATRASSSVRCSICSRPATPWLVAAPRWSTHPRSTSPSCAAAPLLARPPSA